MENWREFIKEEKIPELDSVAQELGIKLSIYSDPRGILTLSKIVVPEDLISYALLPPNASSWVRALILSLSSAY